MSKFEVFVEEQAEVKVVEAEVRRRPDRKALGCLNNAILDNKAQGSKTHFPQKQHKKKQDKSKATPAKPSASEVKVVVDSSNDYFMASGYDVLENLKMLESQQLVRANYMCKQEELTLHMRSVLVEWLIDFSAQFSPAPEVIFIALNYLDRFLSIMKVKQCRLQLLGLTCLNVAWKYEDANSRPNLNDLIYFTDNACTYEEVVTMEMLLVNTIDFRLTAATPLHFLCAFLSHSPLPPTNTLAAKHLLKKTLLEGSCSFKHQPSLLAASILFIFRTDLCVTPWNDQLVQLTGYAVEVLEACVRELSKLRRKLSVENPADHRTTRSSV